NRIEVLNHEYVSTRGFAAEASRDETVTEQPGRFFLPLPVTAPRPQSGELQAIEACSHAGPGVVTGNPVAADEPKPSGRVQRHWVSPRLAGDEAGGLFRDPLHQPGQRGIGE